MSDKFEKTRIGGLWTKLPSTEKGTKYLTGSIKSEDGKEIHLMIFKNNYKDENPKGPDFIVYQVPPLKLKNKEEIL
jgi:hypothetical protein